MHIDVAKAKELLSKAVETKGADYVYTHDPKSVEKARQEAKKDGFREDSIIRTDSDGTQYTTGCFYRNVDDTPGCIIGQVFYDINPELRLEETGFHANLLEGTGITIDDDAAELMESVQWNQDSGDTWGNSVSRAVEQFESETEDE